MSFIKRAGLYCLRQHFRSFILFALFAVAASLILTGFILRDAYSLADANMQKVIGGKIILETDMEGHMGSGQQNQWGITYTYNGDFITRDMVEAISRVKGVVDSNVEEKEGFFGAAVDFKYLPASFQISYTPYGQEAVYTATMSSERCSDFESGKYTLVSGRHITRDDKYAVLISKELADYNKLSVGDKITLYSMGIDSGQENEFQIVGIFDGTEGLGKDALLAGDIPANCGYVDCEAVQEIYSSDDEEDGYQQLTIYVEDPVSIQNVYDKIADLPELKGKTLKLTIDKNEYDTVSTPLDSFRSLVNITIIIIILISIAILTLLLTMWIRGRKKEIGILLCAGTGRINILAQLFTEVLIIAAISFAFSTVFSYFIADRAGSFLLSRITADAGHIDVHIEAACLLPVYMAGLVLIAASVTAASWTVIRLKPKDIL